MALQALLDTSAFVRWLDGSLPTQVRRRLDRAELLVSIVTAWEIAIKPELTQAGFRPGVVERSLEAMGARLLPITPRHTDALYALPRHHKDPFDRMLIAQALVERCTLVSPDQRIPLYRNVGLKVFWD
jgi:PIN domain nuclease of toxin-antitoxin system